MYQHGREIRIDDLNPWVLLNKLQIKDTQNITLTLLKLSTQSPFGHCSEFYSLSAIDTAFTSHKVLDGDRNLQVTGRGW